MSRLEDYLFAILYVEASFLWMTDAPTCEVVDVGLFVVAEGYFFDACGDVSWLDGLFLAHFREVSAVSTDRGVAVCYLGESTIRLHDVASHGYCAFFVSALHDVSCGRSVF